MDAIRWIFSPNPDINYDVISMMYGFASVLCVALYLFERYLTGSIADSKLKDQGGESTTASELFSSLEGVHLIFAPFIPCLLWSLTIRYNVDQKKDKNKED